MKRLCFFLLAVCSALTLPGVGSAAELHLTPTLCAIDEGEDACSIPVNVTFAAEDNARYCLSISGKGLVHCFAGSSSTEMQIYVTAEANTQFLITEGESGDKVATAMLKVARYRPTRHQRRYGWGLL